MKRYNILFKSGSSVSVDLEYLRRTTDSFGRDAIEWSSVGSPQGIVRLNFDDVSMITEHEIEDD